MLSLKSRLNKIVFAGLLGVGVLAGQSSYAVTCTATNGANIFHHAFVFDSADNYVGYTTPWKELNKNGYYYLNPPCDKKRQDLYTSILPAPDLTPAFDGWYNIPENEYIQVAVQVYVAGKKKQYYDVPTYNVSNGCGSTHCVDKVGTGGQAKIRLRVKRKFVGRTSIISRLVTSVYMNTLANEPVGAPVSLIYLSADFNVPQSCTFDVGDIIEFDFGSISASAFANAGAGLPAKGVKVITKNIGLQCKGIDAQQMLTARLEVANPKGNMIVSNNPDVGFQLADKDSKVLIPNNFYSNIPFQLDENVRGNFILKSWPVSITGKRPVAGPVSGQGYVRIDFQ